MDIQPRKSRGPLIRLAEVGLALLALGATLWLPPWALKAFVGIATIASGVFLILVGTILFRPFLKLAARVFLPRPETVDTMVSRRTSDLVIRNVSVLAGMLAIGVGVFVLGDGDKIVEPWFAQAQAWLGL